MKPMDMSLVADIMAQQAGAQQQQVATSMLKQNLDTQKSTALTLLGGAQQTLSLANVGPGIGGNLNIAA
jgi:Putative motility protein